MSKYTKYILPLLFLTFVSTGCGDALKNFVGGKDEPTPSNPGGPNPCLGPDCLPFTGEAGKSVVQISSGQTSSVGTSSSMRAWLAPSAYEMTGSGSGLTLTISRQTADK